MIKIIETPASKVLKDMEHTNIVTFNLNNTQLVEVDGEQYHAKSFSCYNFQITLNGETVVLNGMKLHNSNKFDAFKNIQARNLFLLYNTKKCLIYDNDLGLIGEITEVHDPRNQAERIRDLRLTGEI